MSFFQTTDIGAITNRFSQDLELIDMLLPLRLVNLSDSTGKVLVQLIIVCIIAKYLAISIPFLAMTLYFIQSYYLRTSRQVRLLDIEAKAPLYTHFLETIDGIASIHAFGWGHAFRNQSLSKLDSSQRPFYMLLSIQKWLELVVSLVVGGIAVALVATMTSLKSQFSGASVGVALNLILTFNLNLKRSVENWTLVEVSVGAVQRIQSFSKDTPREDEDGDEDEDESSEKSMVNWITTGEVQLEAVNARYDTSPKPMLANISATIKHGEKVALCGPSGSGKTSFIMALLRMLKTDGKISISTTDIATIPRSLLRRTINVIPQDPLLFPGSVRFNIDPHGLSSTHEIEEASRKVHMWNQIQRAGGLDAELEVSQWSVGQEQLLELARALLVKSPILILDEATSSMDWETESIMQSVIDTEFAGQTVIAVIHRFRYIGRFDRVMLLKQGTLVENDGPGLLMSYDSEFRRLYRASKME